MTSTLDQSRPPSNGSRADVAVSDPVATEGGQPLSEPQIELPRELGRVVGRQPGPTLICLGGMHGNEPAGVVALQRVLPVLEVYRDRLQGEFVGLVGNRQALAAGQRFITADLNRLWFPDRVARIARSRSSLAAEEEELRELDAALQRIIDESTDRVFLLDLHTTSGPGSAFAILDDTLPNREMALDFPVPLVLGFEEELGGTLASFLTAQGVTVLGFEAGQHADAESVERAAAAIWLAIDSAGLLPGGSDDGRISAARTYLRREGRGGVHISEVRYRYHVGSDDRFEMLPGFSNFQPVAAGQVVGRSKAGDVRTPIGGMLLMPLYQRQGSDGFFVVREVRPVWLPVSAILRQWRLERVLPWLPGIDRHPDRPDTFLVDRRYARWLAPQLFHILGYRREGRPGRILTMTRRRDPVT